MITLKTLDHTPHLAELKITYRRGRRRRGDKQATECVLQTASAAIVVAHNHPSGNVEPSPQDIVITERLAAGGRLLGVRLLDHLILTREDSYSFASAGRLEA